MVGYVRTDFCNCSCPLIHSPLFSFFLITFLSVCRWLWSREAGICVKYDMKINRREYKRQYRMFGQQSKLFGGVESFRYFFCLP